MALDKALVQADLVLPPGVDVSGLSDEKKAELSAWYRQEIQATKQGATLQPVRLKINKDAATFVDPFGAQLEVVEGVVVYAHKARGYWIRGADTNVPACASKDGVRGELSEEGRETLPDTYNILNGQQCATCPLNEWGTGVDEAGNRTRGKACKEMRRLFIVQPGALMPIMLTLPPTSITEWDRYVSALLQQNLATIATLTKIDLTTEKAGKFAYAKTRFRVGDRIPLDQMRKLATLRSEIQAYAENAAIQDEDYPTEDSGAAGNDGDPF